MPARRAFRPNRLPVAPPPRRHSVHSPQASGRPRESALEHVRRISREHNKPFDPTKRGTWQGSSKDLVVNPSHRKSTRSAWSEEKGNHQTEEEFIVIEREPDDRNPYVLVNPLEYNNWTRTQLYAMHFGAYGTTCLLIWMGASIEDAAEVAAEWLVKYAPGHITTEEHVGKLMEEVREEEPGIDDEAAYEKATADLTYTEAGWLTSYEWTIDDIHKGDPLFEAALAASKEEYAEVYDEQAPNKRGHRKNARVKNGVPLAEDTGLLLELVRMAAESSELNERYADVTEEVYEQARAYDAALRSALRELVRVHPPKGGATVDDLWNTNAPYLVLMTLRGEGVGIWDGDWDVFYSDTKPAERFLKSKLGKFANDSGSGSLNEAFQNAAYETCSTE